jgi:hypothetical protein
LRIGHEPDLEPIAVGAAADQRKRHGSGGRLEESAAVHRERTLADLAPRGKPAFRCSAGFSPASRAGVANAAVNESGRIEERTAEFEAGGEAAVVGAGPHATARRRERAAIIKSFAECVFTACGRALPRLALGHAN